MDTLVFSGGGLRAISYIGVVKALEEFDMLDTIDTFAGTSSGAVTAFMIVLGYRSQELYDIVKNFTYDLVSDFNFLDLPDSFGIDSGSKILSFFEALIRLKFKSELKPNTKVTFKELYRLTGKKLVINATCLSNMSEEFFDYQLTPDLEVSSALRMSISIPFIFKKVTYNNKVYVDGGLTNNFTIARYNKKKTLGILLEDNIVYNELDDFVSYSVRVWRCIYSQFIKLKSKEYEGYDIIKVNTGAISTLNFDLSLSDRNKVYKGGYKTAKAFLKTLNIHQADGLLKQLLKEMAYSSDA